MQLTPDWKSSWKRRKLKVTYVSVYLTFGFAVWWMLSNYFEMFHQKSEWV